MTMTVVRSFSLGAVERRFQFVDRRHLLGDRAEALGVLAEVDVGQGHVAGVGEQIVEALAAGRALQAVDAAKAVVVEDDDVSFWPCRIDVAISEFIIRYEPSPTMTTTSRSGRASLTPMPPAIS